MLPFPFGDNNSTKHFLTVPNPQSVTPTTSGGATSVGTTSVLNGADITVNCTVELGPGVMESELSLLMVDVQLSRDGIIMRNLSNPMIFSTTLTYTTVLNPFFRSDSGNYTCVATIRPKPFAVYLYGTGKLSSNQIRVTTGSYE